MITGLNISVKENPETGPVNRSRPYVLTFHGRESYLHANVSGRISTLETARMMWSEIATQCSRSGYKNVLLEKDLSEDLQIVEMYNLTKELDPLGLRMICVAIVDPSSDHFVLNEFAAVTASNRGFIHRFFTSVPDAALWLQSPSDW
jgi:hypothetical protein